MLKIKKYSFYFCTIFICACLLAGCSRIFFVKPAGSFSGQVRFDFYENRNESVPSKFKIVEFVVQRRAGDEGWVTSWELAGKQLLSSVEYGAEYDNLKVIVAPAPLEKNVDYRVLVAAVSAAYPKGYSGSEFHFTHSGEMVIKEHK